VKKVLLALTLTLGLLFTGFTAQAADPVTLEVVYYGEFETGEMFLDTSESSKGLPVIIDWKDTKDVKLVHGYTYKVTYKDATAQEIISIKVK